MLRIVLTWPPRKMRAMIATIAMRARISAYSARPWPSSSWRKDEIRAMKLRHVVRYLLSVQISDGRGHGRQQATGRSRTVSSTAVGNALHRVTRQDRRPEGPAVCHLVSSELDRVADRAQDRADLAAQEDEGDDRDDRDQGEDQRVLRETLAFLVAAKRSEERVERAPCGCLLDEYSPPERGLRHYSDGAPVATLA